MASYVAILRKESRSDYGVDFPDFPGCVTIGATRREAERRAHEALRLHIRGMREDGDAIPEPRAVDVIMADPKHRDGTPFLVWIA